jgi:hypothetical protein
MAADRTTRTNRIRRGVTLNHRETVLPAPRAPRGITMNHSETVLPAPRPR